MNNNHGDILHFFNYAVGRCQTLLKSLGINEDYFSSFVFNAQLPPSTKCTITYYPEDKKSYWTHIVIDRGDERICLLGYSSVWKHFSDESFLTKSSQPAINNDKVSAGDTFYDLFSPNNISLTGGIDTEDFPFVFDGNGKMSNIREFDARAKALKHSELLMAIKNRGKADDYFEYGIGQLQKILKQAGIDESKFKLIAFKSNVEDENYIVSYIPSETSPYFSLECLDENGDLGNPLLELLYNKNKKRFASESFIGEFSAQDMLEEKLPDVIVTEEIYDTIKSGILIPTLGYDLNDKEYNFVFDKFGKAIIKPDGTSPGDESAGGNVGGNIGGGAVGGNAGGAPESVIRDTLDTLKNTSNATASDTPVVKTGNDIATSSENFATSQKVESQGGLTFDLDSRTTRRGKEESTVGSDDLEAFLAANPRVIPEGETRSERKEREKAEKKFKNDMKKLSKDIKKIGRRF